MRASVASWLPPARNPLLLVPLLLGASSISTLLLYFYGVAEMGRIVGRMLLPAAALLVLVILWARHTQRAELYERTVAGLWAGALATLAYDIVRLPIAQSGIPVFKAISYFGTVISEQTVPTLTSEVFGWTYHLSNGMGFGLMYAVLVPRPRLWSAVLWGLLLEGAMLATPYAEVFGYKLSERFLAISLGAHVVYGITLWGALRSWLRGRAFGYSPKQPPLRLALTCALVPIGISAIAADFHQRHAQSIPPSPPSYLGSHLYTTWEALEPDRLAALWIVKRFVDPEARFHFVAPFSHIAHGTPFDIPEAAVRRSGTRSASEILLAQGSLETDKQLKTLARMAHLYEIAPWMLPADPRAQQLGQVVMAAAGQCEPANVATCVERAFEYLDRWYALTPF